MSIDYSDKLRDPRWQKKRLEILQRDEWNCQRCHDMESMLVVHHRRYLLDTEPWDYPDELLVTLCESCHEEERVTRPDSESDLLDMLRVLFFADDIHRIANGFRQLELQHASEVIASVYEWALADTEIQGELIERFFAMLKTKHVEGKNG